MKGFVLSRSWSCYFLALGVGIVALGLYVTTLSGWLDDWDSVNFALGLRDYNLVANRPHPPGFPVYIFLGKLFNVLIRNEVLSLTLLSAVSGVLALFLIYALGKASFSAPVGLGAMALAALTPLFWLNSVKAMSVRHAGAVFHVARGLSALQIPARMPGSPFILWGLIFPGSHLRSG